MMNGDALNSYGFYSVFREKGFKLTIQRKMVLDVILENYEEHLTCEEIYHKVKENCPSIGLATIYRTVAMLEEIGLIQSMYLNNDCTRYQLKDPTEKHNHHHLICESCGAIIDMNDDLLEPLEKKVFSQKGFTVNNHRVQFFGRCRKCREKLEQKSMIKLQNNKEE